MAIKRITTLTAVAFVLGIGTSMAQAADQGGYLGVGLGQSKVKGACEGFTSCDDTDTGVKLFGGYQFVPNAAVEIGYINLGKFKGTDSGGFTLESKSHGFDVDFVGTLPLNDQFAVLARVGMFFWKVDLSGNGVASQSGSGNDLTYGLGLVYDVSKKVSVRFEWQQFKDLGVKDLPTKDTDLLFASMVFRIN